MRYIHCGEVINLTIPRMASYCDEQLCCQKSLELFWAQVLPKYGETQISRESKVYLEVVCSHKQRFGEIVEFKVASNQTKLKKGEVEEQEEEVQLKEQGEDMQLEGQGEEVQLDQQGEEMQLEEQGRCSWREERIFGRRQETRSRSQKMSSQKVKNRSERVETSERVEKSERIEKSETIEKSEMIEKS